MRSTFKTVFYVNGSKERNGVVPIMGRVTINGTIAKFTSLASLLLPLALLPLASHIALVTLSLQLNCAIVPLIVTRPMIGTIPFLSLLPFT